MWMGINSAHISAEEPRVLRVSIVNVTPSRCGFNSRPQIYEQPLKFLADGKLD